ncbi:hypothetical protein [Moraxella canis]|uniref:Inhibitor I9 domain-containing protein n=1 Tax=Moraxella canis TaxID=90239 RepID=A0A1S9ZLX5_9GAMM|nr:hypothetical protein [Moraxella canis]OOR84535.1 hypothetical protein B0180_02970 [Moraxella canis]
MKKLTAIALGMSVIALTACQSTSAPSMTQQTGGVTAVPNHAPTTSKPSIDLNSAQAGSLIVYYQPNAKSAVQALASRRGDLVLNEFDIFNAMVVRPVHHDVNATVNAYKAIAGVSKVVVHQGSSTPQMPSQ